MKDIIEYLAHIHRIIRYHFNELKDELSGENFHDWKKMRNMPMIILKLEDITPACGYSTAEIRLGTILDEPNILLDEIPWIPDPINARKIEYPTTRDGNSD